MQIEIGDSRCNAEELALLFHRNLNQEYISHAELQGGRAMTPQEWASNIQDILREEIRARLGAQSAHMAEKGNWRGIILAKLDGVVVGIALATIVRDVPRSFGVIEDIIIDEIHRGRGYGGELLDWIVEAFRNSGLTRVFLESGEGNREAHELFKKHGFRTISIVMMRETS